MTAAKKTTTKKPAAPKKVAAASPRPIKAKVATVAKVVVPLKLAAIDVIIPVFDDILCDYVAGCSLEASVRSRCNGLSVFAARSAINGNPELRKRWLAVKEQRATWMIERAGDVALSMSYSTLQREGAAKLLIQLAGKTDPKNWGDKSTVQLTGADGGDIKTTVTLSPGDAYRKMLGKLK